MKTISKAIIIILFLAVLLTSCTSLASTPTPNPMMETAVALLWTANAETQAAIPTGTPTFPPSTTIPGPYDIFISTPSSDQQVYTDPEGWYSVYFPANMKPMDKPGSFSSPSGFFETGYLPEMGYMSNFMNACFWLANIEMEPEQNIIEPYPYPNSDQCWVSTKAKYDGSVVERIKILENPTADPEHRFIYIKTRKLSIESDNIRVGVFWLKPTTPLRDSTLASFSDEESSLWRKTAPLLQNATVTEYNLPPGSDPNRDAWASKELPEEAFPEWYTNRSNLPIPSKTPTLEEQLKPFGYEFRIISEANPYRQQLLRDGRVLFDYIFSVSDVYKFSTNSGPITAFVVITVTMDPLYGARGFRSFIIQNDAIYAWEYNHQDPRFDPILYQDELLWVKATKDFQHVQILKTNEDVVYSFATYTEPVLSTNRFLAWEGHWILTARDFLFQDGEVLNEKMGFEEIFSWNLIENKPIYLFRRGPRIGLSYDGKILPLEYQDVARYLCCGYAANNPEIDNNSIHFFGKRNGIWYYVVVEFK